MKKISFIYPSDLGNLQQDSNGNYLVPAGFEIYRVPTQEEIRASRIAEIQVIINDFQLQPVPSDAELIEIGKVMHPYYCEKLRLEEELNNLV